ncbi:hypothetical protein YC2023_006568 [Brassica napus]
MDDNKVDVIIDVWGRAPRYNKWSARSFSHYNIFISKHFPTPIGETIYLVVLNNKNSNHAFMIGWYKAFRESVRDPNSNLLLT